MRHHLARLLRRAANRIAPRQITIIWQNPAPRSRLVPPPPEVTRALEEAMRRTRLG